MVPAASQHSCCAISKRSIDSIEEGPYSRKTYVNGFREPIASRRSEVKRLARDQRVNVIRRMDIQQVF